MSFSFNLIEEPFIPCLLADGSPIELGLRETLARAPELREIRDGSPLVTLALYRLLLAILHRNFGPANLRDWKRLWEAGRWDQNKLDDYWQRWRGRFDLFDNEFPFYQMAGFRVKEPSSINRLAHELASGNNATLFDHTLDNDPPPLSPAVAARLVIAQQAFAVGGGKSQTGYTSHAPLIHGAVVFPQWRTLFETLMLNFLAYNATEPIPAEEDLPAWERDRPVPSTGRPQPAGYLDYLTWQSRTLCLHLESVNGSVIVRRVSYAQGRKLEAPSLMDPMMAYRRDKSRGWQPLRLSEHKELWRDSGALFQLTPDDQGKRPGCFNWLARLVADGILSPAQHYDFAVYGLCSDQAKINFWRHDRMPLPLAYLNDGDLVTALQQALKLAEEGGRVLRRSVWHLATLILAPNGQSPDTDRVRSVVDNLAPDRLYWSRLEIPFRQFLVRLAERPDAREQEVARWVKGELSRQAWQAFEQTAGALDHSARMLRAVVQARQRLHSGLSSLLEPYQEILHEQDS
jgi:CRISPR system Cascade subunit CasA